MAQNVLRNNKTIPKKKSESKLLGLFGNPFDIERYIGDEFPVKYLDKALFLLFIGLFVVGVRINAERQIRKIRKMREEVNQAKAQYVILRANYMKLGKQSEIAPKVAPMGIHESRQAPNKIVVSQ